MSTKNKLKVSEVSAKASCHSESPLKPDTDTMEALEPAEDAQGVPSPSSSTYEADQSDAGSDRQGLDDSCLVVPGMVTKEMVAVERKLKEKAQHEEERLKEEREQEWARLREEEKAERFERLQKLLQRSNMYTEYLIDRIKRQRADDAKREERRSRKQARLEERKREEAERGEEQPVTAVGGGSQKENEQTEPRHNLRRKRKASDDGMDKVTSPKTSAPKRRRAMKEAEDNKEVKDKVDEDGGDEVDGAPVSSPAREKTDTATPAGEEEDDDEDNLEIPRFVGGVPVPEIQPLMMTGGILRPYQLEGYQWLRTLYENGVNGILADEMGLGKTVQCIAMVAHMVYMGVPGPFLVCAPLSTVPNWYNEFQRFAPQVPVLLYHGSKEERKELRGQIHKGHRVRPGVSVQTVVITSYEVAMMDQRHLARHEWRYLVVDEGHRIKNTHCRLINALRLYKTTNRLLLTGTPLQNNLAELWSLLNFLLPEIFDDLGSFEAWFDIEHIGDKLAMDKQKQDVLSMLHQILTPFMLRRLKSDVDLCIPPKKEVLVYAPLRPLQKEFYASLIDRTIFSKIQEKNGMVEKEELGAGGRPLRRVTQNRVDYSLMLGSDRDDRSPRSARRKDQEEEELEGWVNALIDMQQKRKVKAAPEKKVSQLSIKLRNVMMQLRKCCSHPFLLEHPLDPGTGELSLDERVVSQSGKMMVLDRMLKELKKRGHKVLIFSQMTRMLDLLEDYCVLRNYGYCRLDGAMNIHDRRDSMAEYQKADSDKFLFLLSTRAGGLGINLTAADTVIIYDSDWNPQCDLQAQDRCHRIGQTRPVMVYRLVTASTIDQRIVERAAAKRKLEKLVIHQGKFKSGIRNFKTSMEPISSEELLKLLNSRDHESEVNHGDSSLISTADLHALLDRSDMVNRWTDNRSLAQDGVGCEEKSAPSPAAPARQGRKGKTVAAKARHTASKAPLFKVIDVEGLDCAEGDL